ncbi:MAG: alpha/beta fold hydrolase [Deltaproteobacteria bacterium]|nr:MAG: alpha/beta fold hydrolase [Deltaproteobacteria bacterium]
MAEVIANGVRHHVQRLGPTTGAPVVFVHGLVMDNLSSWYFTAAPRVARARPVVVYDLRGHGRSDRPATGYTIDVLAADLAALLDALGVFEPIGLAGNSFGGALALAFAARHPERVARMALVDAHGGAPDWAEKMAATLELRGDARDRAIAANFRNWLGRHSARKRTRLAAAAAALVYDTTLVDDIRRSPALAGAQLAAVRCPVLALYGEQSDARAAGERLAAALPDCALRIVPGCTHSVLWERTDEVCGALADWFAEGAR